MPLSRYYAYLLLAYYYSCCLSILCYYAIHFIVATAIYCLRAPYIPALLLSLLMMRVRIDAVAINVERWAMSVCFYTDAAPRIHAWSHALNKPPTALPLLLLLFTPDYDILLRLIRPSANINHFYCHYFHSSPRVTFTTLSALHYAIIFPHQLTFIIDIWRAITGAMMISTTTYRSFIYAHAPLISMVINPRSMPIIHAIISYSLLFIIIIIIFMSRHSLLLPPDARYHYFHYAAHIFYIRHDDIIIMPLHTFYHAIPMIMILWHIPPLFFKRIHASHYTIPVCHVIIIIITTRFEHHATILLLPFSPFYYYHAMLFILLLPLLIPPLFADLHLLLFAPISFRRYTIPRHTPMSPCCHHDHYHDTHATINCCRRSLLFSIICFHVCRCHLIFTVHVTWYLFSTMPLYLMAHRTYLIRLWRRRHHRYAIIINYFHDATYDHDDASVAIIILFRCECPRPHWYRQPLSAIIAEESLDTHDDGALICDIITITIANPNLTLIIIMPRPSTPAIIIAIIIKIFHYYAIIIIHYCWRYFRHDIFAIIVCFTIYYYRYYYAYLPYSNYFIIVVISMIFCLFPSPAHYLLYHAQPFHTCHAHTILFSLSYRHHYYFAIIIIIMPSLTLRSTLSIIIDIRHYFMTPCHYSMISPM